ncbi:MAG: response regulator [Chloroflexi bacterium]|nr:MAG: response regulator [Chloroflexota bacterium]MBL1193796.1 response regulator [Chloroflexota bacterium]
MVDLKNVRALVVEDDSSWQDIFREILEDKGLNVDVVDTHKAAKVSLRANAHRLAIVDLSLGGPDHGNQDGLRVLKAIRRHDPNCAAILVTGFATVELAVKAINKYEALTCMRKEEFSRVAFSNTLDQALVSSKSLVPSPIDRTETNRSETVEAEMGENNEMGRALLVEDDAGWRSLMAELLQVSGYLSEQSSSYVEAIGLLKRNHYQLAVIDLSLASSIEPQVNLDGYRLLASTQAKDIPTIVVSGYAEADKIEQAYEEHNIYACIEKQSFDRSTFLQTLEEAGKIHSGRQILNGLTEREREVLDLLVSGKTNKAIALELYVTPNTVKQHLKSIFAKLDVSSRAGAVAKAVQSEFM